MVVEHTFVTTMAAAETMSTAAHFLQEFGFVAEGQQAFAMEGGVWDSLEVRRGVPKRGNRPRIREWPQQVRLEWDRGRVEVAASAMPPPRGTLDSRGDSIRKKEMPLVQDMLTGVARALELLLVARQPDRARAELAAVDQRLSEISQRDRRRARVWMLFAVVLVVLAIGCLIAVIITAIPHRR
jgi:hypothetical protein